VEAGCCSLVRPKTEIHDSRPRKKASSGLANNCNRPTLVKILVITVAYRILGSEVSFASIRIIFRRIRNRKRLRATGKFVAAVLYRTDSERMHSLVTFIDRLECQNPATISLLFKLSTGADESTMKTTLNYLAVVFLSAVKVEANAQKETDKRIHK
jgi:hypothetical protein